MSCRQHPCGATDCPSCAPDCNDGIECCSCGTTRRRLHTIECRRCGNAVCAACADDGMCVECHKTATEEATLARATAPRVGDVFAWNGSRLTVKCVHDGIVGTLLEHENYYSDAVHTLERWRDSVARTLAHDGVTFTPALDTAAAGVVQCAT